jgi:hypothetical protein
MAQAREGYLQVHRHWLEQQARFQRCEGLQVTTEKPQAGFPARGFLVREGAFSWI